MVNARKATAWVAILCVAQATVLAGCGTTYQVETLDEQAIARANAEIAAERALAAQSGSMDADQKIALYTLVAKRVEPVAEAFCRAETDPGTNCDFALVIDRNPKASANAHQSYVGGQPRLTTTLAFLDKVKSPDELAFVLSHEAGHHIAGHLDKKKTQTALAGVGGALLGALVVMAAASSGRQVNRQTMEQLVGGGAAIGAAGGAIAYSQTYELEADTLGAYIAERAGYDPDAGSRIFARLGVEEGKKPPPGTASFWSTHPSSPERIATVDAVMAKIKAQRASGQEPVPERREE
ncbi:M48 family metalloprotease [Marinibaculum pumilum]|uniref:M48 family metalloprotease n=1 Tax=Marinibaculum pumilum TaxID=1766165 RepID=A0ABV7L298_9PROT